MTQTVNVKAGATFSVAMLVLLPAGTWSASCQVRKGDGTLIEALTVTLAPLSTPGSDGNTHSGLLEATSVQTALWPLGSHRSDVWFTDASTPPVAVPSPTFVIVVDKGETHA